MYRDPVEAGHHRVAALESELAEARRRLAEGTAPPPPLPATPARARRLWPHYLGFAALLGYGAIGYTCSQVHTWPAVHRNGKVVAASPGAPAKVGDTCSFVVAPSEAHGQHFSRSRNCHVQLMCGGHRNDEGEMVFEGNGLLYGGTTFSNEGFMPCLVVDEKPDRGADTMKSSVDHDPALTFDLPANDVVLSDDDYSLRVALQ